jgi:hypothetical protein
VSFKEGNDPGKAPLKELLCRYRTSKDAKAPGRDQAIGMVPAQKYLQVTHFTYHCSGINNSKIGETLHL